MDDILIEQYKKIAKFLAACLGKDYEVAIHEIKNDELKLVCLENGDISKRTINAPLSELALRFISDEKYKNSDYEVNYKGLSGDNVLRSSTFFIKNDKGKLIGLLCINFNIGHINKSIKKINDELKELFDIVDTNNYVEETNVEYFTENISNVISNIIEPIIRKKNLPVARLSFDEKMLLIEELKKQGVFLLKGAVSEAAIQLHSSEASIYRYLKKTKDA
ncbi:PAS domain-containing protein [Anaerorhabdus sp.]|uniref:helix-turn-helix transcriptional regulator n=1 Tax=Anaerorhabdus sp. TaxID=1872524 RepID=UPI002B1EBCEE|nr:PAS domain-containing protein [Anaerorhabdus sp.]MEA4874858.1 PAS domain-containing protein [Anaerorhabdus sp.]